MKALIFILISCLVPFPLKAMSLQERGSGAGGSERNRGREEAFNSSARAATATSDLASSLEARGNEVVVPERLQPETGLRGETTDPAFDDFQEIQFDFYLKQIAAFEKKEKGESQEDYQEAIDALEQAMLYAHKNPELAEQFKEYALLVGTRKEAAATIARANSEMTQKSRPPVPTPSILRLQQKKVYGEFVMDPDRVLYQTKNFLQRLGQFQGHNQRERRLHQKLKQEIVITVKLLISWEKDKRVIPYLPFLDNLMCCYDQALIFQTSILKNEEYIQIPLARKKEQGDPIAAQLIRCNEAMRDSYLGHIDFFKNQLIPVDIKNALMEKQDEARSFLETALSLIATAMKKIDEHDQETRGLSKFEQDQREKFKRVIQNMIRLDMQSAEDFYKKGIARLEGVKKEFEAAKAKANFN